MLTRVTLFHPATYRAYCIQEALDPGSPESRARYAITAAANAASVGFTGQPMPHLLRVLHERMAPPADPALAARELSRARTCQCRDISELRTASHGVTGAALSVLTQILQTAGPGRHQLVCTATLTGAPEGEAESGPLSTVLHASAETRDSSVAVAVHEQQALTTAALLAAAMSTQSPGGIVLRTTREGTQVVRGWQLTNGWPQPLTEGQVLAVYHARPGATQAGSPDPPVHYQAGFDLPQQA